jgi:hypothetical protein
MSVRVSVWRATATDEDPRIAVRARAIIELSPLGVLTTSVAVSGAVAPKPGRGRW